MSSRRARRVACRSLPSHTLKSGRNRRLRLSVLVPLTSALSSYSAGQAGGDLSAGLAAAAVLIPQSMAYGQVAGLPPAAGLSSALGAMLAYALFTSTRLGAVGPTSVMAIMTFSAVQSRADGDAGRAVALAACLSLLSAALCLTGALLRLGALGDLLSKPVMLGYLAGSGLVIIAEQAKKLVGVHIGESRGVDQLWQVVTHLDRAHPLTLAVGGGRLLALVLLRRYIPGLPASLVVLVGAVVVSSLGRLAEQGVAVAGRVAGGLPVPEFPTLGAGDVWALLPAAAGVALVASTEIGVAAAACGEHVKANRELAALGAASTAAGLLGGLPPATSYSRSASARSAGGQTQMFQLVAASMVVVALVAGAPLVARLPLSALAAVAAVSAAGLVDVGGFLRIWRGWRGEAVIALVAAAGVVALGPLGGLVIAVTLAIWELVRRAARPHDAVLAYIGPDQPPTEVREGNSPYSDVLIYRVDAPLFFANAGWIRERVLALASEREPKLRYLILDAEAIFYIDSTAAAALARLTVDLRARNWASPLSVETC